MGGLDRATCTEPRPTDTQWRHKSKKSENLGWCGRQNMLRPYLQIWEWVLIFGRAVKAISSPCVRSPCLTLLSNSSCTNLEQHQFFWVPKKVHLKALRLSKYTVNKVSLYWVKVYKVQIYSIVFMIKISFWKMLCMFWGLRRGILFMLDFDPPWHKAFMLW